MIEVMGTYLLDKIVNKLMTNIRGAISGAHPLSEELIQKILDYKYGRASKKPIKELFFLELKNLIELQTNLEFPIVSTGNLGIEDLIRPFTRSLDSLKSYETLNDLPIVRYHYTNTFYRQPALVSTFPKESNVLLNDIHSLTDDSTFHHEFLKDKLSKIILPGPYSFSKLIATNGSTPYNSFDELLAGITDFLIAEINNLPDQYVEIQFDEPYFVWERVDRIIRPVINYEYNKLCQQTDQQSIIVNTYFEPADNLLSFLLELPVSGIGIDFVNTNLTKLSDYDFSGKLLQAGLIDSQNFIPNVDGSLSTQDNFYKARLVQSLLELNPSELVLTSTTGLEYLPKEIADQKLKQISQIIKLVEEL